MSKSIGKSAKFQFMTISTAEAFYRVFCALPKNDQLAVVRYILEDEKIQQNLEIPNETTLKAFAEDKSKMQVFHTIDELRKDLLM
ncbi:MAG: hypothetical protein KAW92_11075 [Candidatus Cloacimonetes bacterium]|nr:hypothetical protein [Candidatus Cloacimonadota bacterium]